MKIGIESESLHLWIQNGRMDIFGFIEKCDEIGADGVIINVVKDYGLDEKWGALGSNAPEHLAKIKALLKEKDMFVEIDMRNLDHDRLIEVIEVAHQLGARVVRSYIPITINRENLITNAAEGAYDIVKVRQDFDPKALDEAVVSLKKIVPYLEKYRIRLAIENHEYEISTELVDVIKQVDSPWVGLLYDFGNSMMAWEDPIVAARNMAPYTFSTHCKDHIIIKDETVDFGYVVCGVPLGEGNVDIAAAYKELYHHSPIESINLEMCYPYCAEFKRSVGAGGVYGVGHGPFKVEEPLYPELQPKQYYYPQEVSEEWLERLLQEQMDGLINGMNYLRGVVERVEAESNC